MKAGILALGVFLMATGCASLSELGRAPRRLYDGPVRDPSTVATIYNDEHVFVSPTWSYCVAVLPTTDTLQIEYYKVEGSLVWSSIAPVDLEVDLQPGHRYQIIGSEYGISFVPSIEDVTSQSNVWAFYEKRLGENLQLRAVTDWMSDPLNLARVAQDNPNPQLRMAAVRKLDDHAVLDRVLSEDIDAEVRRAAQRRKQELERMAVRVP